jgi:hypothetical protein
MVDTLVDDLAYTLNVGRESLNVVRLCVTPARARTLSLCSPMVMLTKS